MFHSAGDTNVGGGIFSLVNGNQNQYHYHYSQPSSERSLVRILPGEEWKEMLYQEYEPIPLGRIKLHRTLHRKNYNPLVDTWQRRHLRALKQDYRPEAERVVEIVSITNPDGRNESNPLLAVRYTGRDASKPFKEDCILFSHQRVTAMAQLRAFNDSCHIPFIIFNEELVSAQHFLERHRYSVQARCYLHFHIKARVCPFAVRDYDADLLY
ncbi:hypothetical protein PQX77_017587 [Marasmius sp. AFHP31]|nr:hypothetical protein PQX77_017587 [Marasmius sp. AFHP31]